MREFFDEAYEKLQAPIRREEEMRREKEALLGFTFTRESEPGLVARDSISFR